MLECPVDAHGPKTDLTRPVNITEPVFFPSNPLDVILIVNWVFSLALDYSFLLHPRSEMRFPFLCRLH